MKCQEINSLKVTVSTKREFNCGDEVMVDENNYAMKLMNGEDGSIQKVQTYCQKSNEVECECRKCRPDNIYTLHISGRVIDLIQDHGNYVKVKIRYGRVTKSLTKVSLTLAYAITTHKAQGSEWKHIIVFLDERNEHITRNWLYTALTRTKNKIYIVCQAVSDLNAIVAQRDNYPLNWFEYSVKRRTSEKTEGKAYGQKFFESYCHKSVTNQKYLMDHERCDGRFTFTLAGQDYGINIEYDDEQNFEDTSSQEVDLEKTGAIWSSGESLIRIWNRNGPQLRNIMDKTVKCLIGGYQIIFAIDYETKSYIVDYFIAGECVKRTGLLEFLAELEY